MYCTLLPLNFGFALFVRLLNVFERFFRSEMRLVKQLVGQVLSVFSGVELRDLILDLLLILIGTLSHLLSFLGFLSVCELNALVKLEFFVLAPLLQASNTVLMAFQAFFDTNVNLCLGFLPVAEIVLLHSKRSITSQESGHCRMIRIGNLP